MPLPLVLSPFDVDLLGRASRKCLLQLSVLPVSTEKWERYLTNQLESPWHDPVMLIGYRKFLVLLHCGAGHFLNIGDLNQQSLVRAPYIGRLPLDFSA